MQVSAAHGRAEPRHVRHTLLDVAGFLFQNADVILPEFGKCSLQIDRVREKTSLAKGLPYIVTRIEPPLLHWT
ncbi:MAG: hypothetical protein OXL36_02640 [Bryobacterales bacterium]|nr:hypothetical protein [Bryobacterales bacterium]MDE0296153.1 hypothetical protein [Bryobacterales bacterium]